MKKWTVEKLPDEALPNIEELTGDMRVLAEMVGVRKALEISQWFDGTPGRFYGHTKWIRRWRDQCMRRDYDSGDYSVVDIARNYGVSERQAYNVLGKEPEEDRQLSFW